MKKLFCLFVLFFTGLMCAQETTTPAFSKNELKVNALFLMIGAGEFTYERLINEESGFGICSLITYDQNELDRKFELTPFYHFYFGKKPAAGFFVEGFGMLNTTRNQNEVTEYIYNQYGYYTSVTTSNPINKTDFAVGFGIGGKWITKRGFIFEISSGLGRNLGASSKNSDDRFVGRFGITAGYRF